MEKKRRKSAKRKPLTPKDKMKIAIAKQLGIYDQVRRDGWGGLSAKECGQVGGMLSRTLKDLEAGGAKGARGRGAAAPVGRKKPPAAQDVSAL